MYALYIVQNDIFCSTMPFLNSIVIFNEKNLGDFYKLMYLCLSNIKVFLSFFNPTSTHANFYTNFYSAELGRYSHLNMG